MSVSNVVYLSNVIVRLAVKHFITHMDNTEVGQGGMKLYAKFLVK